jgi:hypothetical protein
MSNTPLEALTAEAGSRLSDYELVRDISMRAAEESNALGIEAFPLEGGTVHCVGSRITTERPTIADKLSVEDGLLQRHREYPNFTARAYFVGMWPRANEAALYQVVAPFNAASESGTTDFTSTVLDVFATANIPPYYSQYHPVESAPDSTLLATSTGDHKTYDRGLDMRVVGRTGATITASQFGIDTIHDQEGLRVALTGPAKLHLPASEFIKVTPNAVLASPDRAQVFDIDIQADPEPPVVSKVIVPTGVVPTLDHDGRVVLPGAKNDGYEHDTYQNNPVIRAEQAQALLGDQLPLEDITTKFLETARGALLERVTLGTALTYDRLATLATEAIAETLRTKAIQPIAIGYLAVGNRIRDALVDLNRSGREVTAEDLATAFKRRP